MHLWLRTFVWTLFFELGYGALGLRWDDARDDLPTADGDIESALQTHPGIAWLVAVGGGIPVLDELQVVFRVEYRVRYYISRDGRKNRDVMRNCRCRTISSAKTVAKTSNNMDGLAALEGILQARRLRYPHKFFDHFDRLAGW